jgi:alkanesulfonate monooxygenase SsuD/methylene tetrahydromethanopterin reductase-like flavin-dependent oxidoreductase (luciferase family)
VLIGRSGERKTLRPVARYGDACNLFADDAADVARKLDVLRRHCDDVGRDPATVRTTLVHRTDAPAAGEVDAFLALLEGCADLGVDQVMVIPARGLPPDRWIHDVGRDLAPRLAEL